MGAQVIDGVRVDLDAEGFGDRIDVVLLPERAAYYDVAHLPAEERLAGLAYSLGRG